MPLNLSFNLRFRLRRLAAALAILFVATYAQSTRAAPSFVFYYGADIPWEALGAFDVAVVEPGNVGPAGWRHRLNPGTTAADREWILTQLRKCQTEYKLPVIAVDYVPPNNRALARETAKKIRALGIIPWVTTPPWT